MDKLDFRLEAGRYRSWVAPTAWFDIPDFAVLVGENGSGKTQLLELMYGSRNMCDQVLSWRSRHSPSTNDAAVYSAIRGKIDNKGWKTLDSSSAWLQGTLASRHIMYLNSKYELQDRTNASNLTSVKKTRSKVNSTVTRLVNHHKNHRTILAVDDYTSGFDENAILLHKYLEEQHGLNYYEKDVADLERGLPYRYSITTDTQFSMYFQELGNIFFQYSLLEADFYRRKGRDQESITEGELEQIIGPAPWHAANAMLSSSGLKYKFTEPSGLSVEEDFLLKLVDVEDETIQVKVQELSSGERVLISLFVFFLRAKHYQLAPRLLLLDEPDAHLHSSQIPGLIRTIQDVFVRDHNCRVIMTTHRPETIVATPPHSLFEIATRPEVVQISCATWWPDIDKSVEHDELDVYDRVLPITDRDGLLDRLTGNAFYINRKIVHVLVEDKDDEQFFSLVCRHLVQNNRIPSDPMLFFQGVNNGASKGSGGCTWVEAMLRRLRKPSDSTQKDLPFSGKLIVGLIDKDDNNSPDATIGLHTLPRYSIENFLADPVLIYSHIIEKNKSTSCGITAHHVRGENHGIQSEDSAKLQMIANEVLDKVFPFVEVDEAQGDLELEEIDFLGKNPIKLMYPKWILRTRGKNLLDSYGKAFPNCGGFGVYPLLLQLEHLRLYPADLAQTISALIEIS